MTGKAKNILIAGAPTICWPNSGDEAIFAAMADDLRSVAPDASLTVASCNPDGTLERYGARGIPFSDMESLIDAAKSSDLMILGGGSLFYDYWGFNASAILTKEHQGLTFYSGFALLASLLNKPLMIYAVGVGPLQSEMGRYFTRLAFEQAQASSVRDAESKALLDTLGFDAGQVRVTADPVFSLQREERKGVASVLEREGREKMGRPFIGVALRNWDVGVDPEAWERDVASALDAFIERHDGTPLFMPLHKTMDSELTDDTAVADRVSRLMLHRDKAVVFREEYLPEERAELLEDCDLVLGMRLHSVIFAIKGGVPTVALTYDPKVTSALRSVDCQQYGIKPDELTAHRLASLLEEAYEHRAELRELLKVKAKRLLNLSRENRMMAAELLRRDPQPRRVLTPFTVDLLKSLGINHALRAFELQDAASLLEAQAERSHEDEAASASHLALSINRARLKPSAPVYKERAPQRRKQKADKRRVACLTNRLLDWETQEPCIGGGERYCLTLGYLLRELGFDITFYQSASKSFKGDYHGLKVVGLPHGEGFSEFQYGSCDAFYELSADYDHVIYNLANYASGRVREDAILICHGIWFDYESPSFFSFRTPEWFEHLYNAFSRPKKIVSVDANSINVIRSLWPEVATRMTYLPNWVDTNLFYPPTERQSSPVRIIFPRRCNPERGARLLGPLLERVRHDCSIYWVGEGEVEDNEHVKALARRDPRLKFYTASFERMPELYRAADICVIPTVASEGTSLSCLEALASGCAVVATTVGGLPELIQHRVNGLLVDPQPEQLAAAINRLIEEPPERTRLQQAAPRTAASFSLEIWQRRWTDLLRQLGWLEEVEEDAGKPAKRNLQNDRQRTASGERAGEPDEGLRLLSYDSARDEAFTSFQSETREDSEDESLRLLKRKALHLTASLAERERAVMELESRVNEQEQTVQTLSKKLEAREKMIQGLHTELDELRRKEQLADESNGSSKAQVSFGKRAGRRLKAQLVARKAQLQRMLRLMNRR